MVRACHGPVASRDSRPDVAWTHCDVADSIGREHPCSEVIRVTHTDRGLDTRDDLVRCLHTWWLEAVQHRKGEFAGRQQPLLPPEVTDADAHSFLRGLDADPPLYTVKNGYLLSPLMAPHKDGTPKVNFHLFETTARAMQLRSETFVHYGAAADLVFDRGWPASSIVSEPHGSENVTKGSLDLIVRRGNEIAISVEAKGPESYLRKLIDGMNRCTGSIGAGHNKSDHNKCLGLLLFRSPLFLGVSCGLVRDLFRVQFDEGFVRLVAEPDLTVLDA